MAGPLDEPLIYRKDISPGEYAYMNADQSCERLPINEDLGARAMAW